MSFYARTVTSSRAQTGKRTSRTARTFASALLACALAATACGSSADEAAQPAATTAVSEDGAASADGGIELGQTNGEDSGAPSSSSVEAETATPSSDGTLTTDGNRARLGDQVLAANRTVSTGRFEGRITVEGDVEFPDGIELLIEGSYDTANQASELSLDLGAAALAAAAAEGADLGPFAAMFEEPMIVRTVGTRAFVSWGLLSLLTGGQGTWIESEVAEAADLTSSLGASTTGSPSDFLEAIEDANAEITEIGSEEVRGVSTTHVQALVDLAELDAGLSAEDRATLEQDLGSLTTSEFPIDFWIDDEGLIRRYSMMLDEGGSTGDVLAQASLVFEFFDYGADVAIDVPPADEIISADELDLGALDFGN